MVSHNTSLYRMFHIPHLNLSNDSTLSNGLSLINNVKAKYLNEPLFYTAAPISVQWERIYYKIFLSNS